jgi:hypothetical protein
MSGIMKGRVNVQDQQMSPPYGCGDRIYASSPV